MAEFAGFEPLWPTRPLLGADDAPFVGLTEASAEQFVTAILAANPGLPAREAAWEAARARAAQAPALEDPTLSYAFAPETLGDSEEEISHAVELSQRLPWPGKRASRGLRAEHEAQAVREDIDATRLKPIAAAKDSFADWYYRPPSHRRSRCSWSAGESGPMNIR